MHSSWENNLRSSHVLIWLMEPGPEGILWHGVRSCSWYCWYVGVNKDSHVLYPLQSYNPTLISDFIYSRHDCRMGGQPEGASFQLWHNGTSAETTSDTQVNLQYTFRSSSLMVKGLSCQTTLCDTEEWLPGATLDNIFPVIWRTSRSKRYDLEEMLL